MSRSLKITLIAVFVGVFVLAVPLATHAAPAPSAEFTGLPSNTDCIGGTYAVPTQYNTPTTARMIGSLTVPGVGVVASYDQDIQRTDAGYYNFNAGAFSVPSGTVFTAVLTTYDGPAPSTTVAYVSTLVFACGTGTLISLNGVGAGAGPDMYPLPDYAVVGTFTQNTPLYFAPQAGAETDTVMEIGKSLWVIGINEAGTFYKVLLSGQTAWVPVGTIGPTYDDVWNGTPLPTEVVN